MPFAEKLAKLRKDSGDTVQQTVQIMEGHHSTAG
jgi:hypothetical protein